VAGSLQVFLQGSTASLEIYVIMVFRGQLSLLQIMTNSRNPS